MASIFTRIMDGEISGTIVRETPEAVAIQDINPQAPAHYLIVPRREIESVNDVEHSDAKLIGNLVVLAKELAAEKGIAEDGYRLVFNVGKDGGQTVDHIHLHLLGGRAMEWPPG